MPKSKKLTQQQKVNKDVMEAIDKLIKKHSHNEVSEVINRWFQRHKEVSNLEGEKRRIEKRLKEIK